MLDLSNLTMNSDQIPVFNNLPLDAIQSQIEGQGFSVNAKQTARKAKSKEVVNEVPQLKSTATKKRLDDSLRRAEERIKAIKKAAEEKKSEPDSNIDNSPKQQDLDLVILQEVLPAWSDQKRGVPNPFIRSGLFSVTNAANRAFIEKEKVASLSNYDMIYSGQQLGQDDLSVWLSLINLAKESPVTNRIHFSGYSLVVDLGWRMHSESYSRVRQCIERLKVTGVTITPTGSLKGGYTGSLIREYAWQEEDEKGRIRWMVAFDPKISQLFLRDTTTLLAWEQRRAIGARATLALWLHAFYSSHTNPFEYSVAKLHELSKSESKLNVFRRNLKLALERNREIGFLRDYTIENDIVSVVKISHNSLN